MKGIPIPAKEPGGVSRGPQRPMKLHLGQERNCLLVVILHLWLNSIISSSSCSTSFPDHCLSFCPGVGTSSALVVCALGLLHGNWHGLALPNCYLKAFHSLLIQVLKERNAHEFFVRGFAFGTATSRPSIAPTYTGAERTECSGFCCSWACILELLLG